MPQQLFVFIQLEFPWALGPPDGRYLIRRDSDGEAERVVVIGALDATGEPIPQSVTPRRTRGARLHRLRGRRRGVPTGPEPAPVRTTRVTVIDPISLSAESQARAWLAELNRTLEVGGAVAVVNRVIHSHRIAAADPYVHEVSAEQALVIRAGWGEGEQVADGRWLHARALPWAQGPSARRSSGRARAGARRDRSWALRPQERLAVLLAGRGAALLCEELALRARQDLDHGRLEHAAHELDRALELAVAELQGERRQDLAIRIAELEHLRPAVREQARASMPAAGDAPSTSGEAEPAKAPDADVLGNALERLEATLRARTATGFER
jgi:hypothetical protein